MLPVNCGSHADYQNFVLENLRKYYPNPDSIARSTGDIIDRFWNLDLSFTDEFMRDKYSRFGPAPRTPSCMQRFYLLSIDFKVTSLTDWAAQLKINPLYAILGGFEFGNTPGVGTFYDFMNRLWDSDDDHLSSHIHPLKTKVKKPKTKSTKADSVENFECEVNDLPLSMVLSWYEQKAVCILLTLLHLGIKNILLGPSLPAFISPNVLDFLVKNYNIAPISTPEEDMTKLLAK